MAVLGGDGIGKHTESAGTVISNLTTCRVDAWTNLDKVVYTAGATAHTITVMRGTTQHLTLTEAVTASDTTWVVDTAPLDGDGNAVASGDYVALQLADGTWLLDTAASLSSKTITVNTGTSATQTANVGARVVVFGVAGDTYHANYTFTAGSGATTTLTANTGGGGLVRSRFGEPLLIQSNNATNAGTLDYAQWVFSR